MEVVETLVALPGCCWKCRSSNREKYLDTGMSVEFHGAVYLCDECCTEIGHAFGMLTKGEVQGYLTRNERLEEDIFDYKTHIAGLEQAIDGLRIAGSVSRSDSNSGSFVPVHSEPEGFEGSEESVGSGAGEITEPLHDEGMAELSDDDSELGFKLSL